MIHSWSRYLYTFFCLVIIHSYAIGQFDPIKVCVTNVNGECIPNSLLTVMPFLRIIPDARSGAMGDVGLATTADANSMHFNASKLVFTERNFSISASYTPWLRELDRKGVYLAYLSGYKRLSDGHAIGLSLKTFSLGDTNFIDLNGNIAGMGKPREMEIAGAYALKIKNNFSIGITAKYISSDLGIPQQVHSPDFESPKSFAAGFSMTYQTEIGTNDNELRLATSISNLGPKLSYTNSTVTDFLPGNLGIGTSYKHNFNSNHSLTLAVDVNKLLVPTPQPFRIIENPGESNERETDNPNFDRNGPDNFGPDGFADYRQQSLFSGVFSSFTDAPGGFSEELQELTYSGGLEYLFKNTLAIRTGYFYEHALKGNRKYLTAGIGINYKRLSLDFSYLKPRSNSRSLLNNTLRLSLIFNGSMFQS